MLPYIEGDPRFKMVKRDTHSLIYAWAQKEFKNLKRAYDCGIRLPKPIYVEKNVLVMEFIGEEDQAAPTLKEQPPEHPEKTYEKILEYVKILYQQAKLVHGDLSEYNIMNIADEPVLFDVSQTVTNDHPKAKEFLHRDLTNVNRFFAKQGVKIRAIDTLSEWVTQNVG